MFVHVFCYPNKVNQTVKQLKKNNMFSDIKKLDKKNAIKVITKKPILTNDITTRLKIEQKLAKLPTIRSVTIFTLREKDKKYKKIEPRKNKIKHIFFDIDSTITHHPAPTIYREIKDKFANFTAHNVAIYFCTGRDKKHVEALIKKFNTSPYGIAEAGGIIINSNIPNEKFGDRSEPDKLLLFIQNNYKKAQIDNNQQGRTTEVILKRESITRNQLDTAKNKSKAKIEIHESKNTYHITKKGINKGTAISYLASVDELDLGENHVLYSVGDSELDIPMFNATNASFAVENATNETKKAATITLKESGVGRIDEIYEHIFKFS